MDLLTILISGIGGGIAKGILNIWLEEDNEMFAKEISKNFVGILASKAKDVLAGRKGGRQFAEISEKIAVNLLPIFNAAKSISDTRKKEIAEITGIAVQNLRLTPELLATHNLNPKKIEELLLSQAVFPNEESPLIGFTPTEIQLYKRIISESAQNMVDIASNLPSFTENTFAEVLNREDSIIGIATKILDEVQRIKKMNESSDERAHEFETDYRRAVVRRLDEITLFGVDLSRSSKRYRLSTAYVRLSAEFKQENEYYSKKEENTTSVLKEIYGFEDIELLSIDEVINRSNRLLLRGQAGSGKTTLMQWVAVMSARNSLKGDLANWNNCVPFFIRLREFSDKPLPKLEEFPALISPALSNEMPLRWVNDKLKAEQAIILLDGVDEIAKNQRGKIKEWLKDIDSTYPNNKWIVTSRPYAAKEDWLSEFGFLNATLQDMNIRDIEIFIKHWHQAVKETELEPEKKTELEILQKKLKATIKENHSLRKLATNPLLCAMICALHRDRYTQLPSDKVALYEACISMFLRRDTERYVDLKDYSNIGERQKIALLSDFAYWLIKNNWSEIDVGKTDERFEKKKIGLSLKTNGLNIRRYFVERSGILRQPTVNSIDFPHRTFQEFLAAKEIVSEGDFGVLQNNIYNDQWREVIQLSCGLARRIESDKLILEILKTGDKTPKHKISLYLLAVACLDSTIEKNPTTIKEVEERLRTILPPKNIPTATRLAKAGEIVTPYLGYSSRKKANELAASIRTLSLIGDEKALTQLKGYTNDRRKTVKKALMDGIKYCDHPHNYAKELSIEIDKVYLDSNMPLDILSCLSNVKEIKSSWMDIRNLEPFIHLSTLKKLHIQNIYPIQSLAPLGKLDSLEDLKISIKKENELNIIGKLKNLKRLELVISSSKSDLTPLKNLKNLTYFHLSLINEFNYKSLLKLNNVTHLSIYNPDVSDLSFTNNLDGITNFSLYLSGYRNTGFYERLLTLTKLTSFTFYNVETLDLNFLKTLKRLKILKIEGNSLRDLSVFSDLTNLEYLSINTLPEPDLRALKNLENLERLELPTAKKVDLRPLQHLNKIWVITPSLNFGRPLPIFLQRLKT